MSSTVDQRIVEMQFDNKQFESGIQTSLKSLKSLEKGLQLDGATKGLTELDRATKSFSFESLANSVDAIASKFSAFGIMGVTALQNIANSVYNTAKSIASSFTIDPIKTGFAEYETQINAVQTILANTQKEGTTLVEVSKALDELNAYADKTIYNFTEMTRNIGTFTAAGVKLETATNAIQGIANLAAVSGSTSQQASTAMYQLSQAMASGTVKLMDWNSVVNAGMGGQVFQDALTETARAHGISIDKLIEKHGSFRETLSSGWLTTEVLTETLEKFTATTEGLTEEQIQANREMWKARGYTEEQIDAIFELGKTATDAATKVKTFTQLFDTLKEAAQSGWTQSWEIIVGDFDEAKELLTQISDEIGGVINASALARNTLLQAWKDLGGRDDVIAGFKNLYEAILAIITPAREAFREIFPATTADQLKAFTQKFEDITAKFKIGEKTSKNLNRTFAGFFAILDIGAQGISALASGFSKLIGYSLPIGSNILEMSASLGDFLVELSKTSREIGIFEGAMDLAQEGIRIAAEAFGKLTSKGADLLKFFEEIDLSGIEVKFEPLKMLSEAGAWAIDKLRTAMEKAAPIFSKFAGYARDAFGKFASAIGDAVNNGSLTALGTVVNGGLLGGLIVGVMKIADAFKGIAKNAGGFLKNLNEIFEGVTDALSGMQNKLNADALKSIAIAIAILAASLAVLSLVDQDNLGGSLTAITTMFVELIAALAATTELMSGAKNLKFKSTISAMKGMATAILILAAAMAIMGKMDAGALMTGLVATISLLGMLTIVTKQLGDGSVQMLKGSSSLMAFAVAIGILALSVKFLGSMDLTSVGKGLLALGGILLELCLFLKTYNISAMSATSGLGIMFLASGILILAGALKVMATMSVNEIAKSLLVLAGSLSFMSLAVSAMPGNMLAIGTGLLGVAASMLILSAALKIMATMSWDEIGRGMIVLASSLLFLTVALSSMTGTIGGSVAILIASAALVVLAGALKLFAIMSVGDIIKSLATLAATLAVIGGAATLLAPLTPAILLLSASLLAFGIAAAATGGALVVLGAGLSAIGVGITALVTAIVASITAIISAIPVFAEQIGAAVVAIADAISAASPACAGAISAVIQAIVDIIVNGVSAISTAIGGVGPALLKLAALLIGVGVTAAVLQPLVPAIIALSVALGAFGASCAAIAVGVLALAGALELLGLSGLAVAASLTDIYSSVKSMGDMSLDAVHDASKLFRSAGKEAAKIIIDGLDEGLDGSEDTMAALIKTMITQVNKSDEELAKVGTSLAESFATSLRSALQNGVDAATESGKTSMTLLIVSCIGIFTNASSQFRSAGISMMSNLSFGITKQKSAVVATVQVVGKALVTTIGTYSDDFYVVGGDMSQGLANGINAKRYLAVNAATNLGIATKNAMKKSVDSNSPSKDFEDIGMWCDMGLANGLIKFARLATNAATYLGESTIQPVMTMTDDMLNDLGNMGTALRGTAALASSLDSTITSKQQITVNHAFEDLTVRGVNDRNEFVAVADYSVEEVLTELIRKGIRR